MIALKERVEARLNQGLLAQWYVIAKSSQIPAGQVFATKALGIGLVLWRGEDGTLRCLEDLCPHRGAPLSRGFVRGNNIACAYHGVQISGDGIVQKVPALPGCALEGRKESREFIVEEHQDGVFCWFPSATQIEPLPLDLPYELTDDSYAHFLTTGIWETNYRYAVENIADPMHGPYLHGGTFTLSDGRKDDTVRLAWVDGGFNVSRVQQQGENFDWAELIVENGAPHCRVNIPYPPAGGPGGMMRVVNFITPVDPLTSRIFFWRTRQVSGLEREVWRFLFRATFEERHWAVLEQDREMLAAMSDDARKRERLYQHDIGITRLRLMLSKIAKAQIEGEDQSQETKDARILA